MAPRCRWSDDDDATLVSKLRWAKENGYQSDSGWKPQVWALCVEVLKDSPGPPKVADKVHDHWGNATKDQQAEATRFKKEFIATSTQRIEDAASFDDLAGVFGDVLKWTEGSKAISVEFGKVLRAIQERLVNHLTILSTPAVGLPGIETTFRAVRRPAQGHSFPV
ncbi:hypothetical protein B0H11DRAFT_1901329 [Mycena galericulata]|nr:hypothetical protein B0H11DRAFT_1901329 [Mycena galericulata]